MATLRADLQVVLNKLLSASAATMVVTLDAVGDAIGARAVSTDEIDILLTHLEAAGRTVLAPQGGEGETRLRQVVEATRELKTELGRAPSTQEVATRAQLSPAQVRQALQLLTIMQR